MLKASKQRSDPWRQQFKFYLNVECTVSWLELLVCTEQLRYKVPYFKRCKCLQWYFCHKRILNALNAYYKCRICYVMLNCTFQDFFVYRHRDIHLVGFVFQNDQNLIIICNGKLLCFLLDQTCYFRAASEW